MNPRLFFQRHRALSVCFSRFPISLPYLLPVHRCRRTGVSSITFTINVQATPLTQCSQSGSMTTCTGSFLPASSPGALVSSSAPNGWVIYNATLAGAYVNAPRTAYIVPTATGYILAAQDDNFVKMVQVSRPLNIQGLAYARSMQWGIWGRYLACVSSPPPTYTFCRRPSGHHGTIWKQSLRLCSCCQVCTFQNCHPSPQRIIRALSLGHSQ